MKPQVYQLNADNKAAIELIPENDEQQQPSITVENGTSASSSSSSSLLSLHLENFTGRLLEKRIENGPQKEGEKEAAAAAISDSDENETISSNYNNSVVVIPKDPDTSYVKIQIPSELRAARRAKLGADDTAAAAAPTRLHQLCAMPNVTLQELQVQLHKDPKAASVKDSNGCFPLHVLGNNDALLISPLGKQTASAFVWQLVHVHPDAITTLDKDGFMPFVRLIKDWYVYIYEKDQTSDDDTTTAFTTTERRNDSTTTLVERESALLTKSTTCFPQAGMWQEVEWSFDMLSLEMDELGGKNGNLFTTHKSGRPGLSRDGHNNTKASNKARLALATHVAQQMPTILKAILLLNDEGGKTRKRLLASSMVRRMLLCSETVSTPWLIRMLHRRKGLAFQRAIDYLVLVSLTTPRDHVGNYRAILPEDELAYQEELDNVFGVLSSLQGLVASLVVLPDVDTERAALTHVMWHIMTKSLARPLTVSLVLIDFVLLLVLLVAFRKDLRDGLKLQSAGSDLVGGVPAQVIYVICAHSFVRKAGETVSLLAISAKVWRSYFTNMWTVFDFLAIVLTVVATSLNQTRPEMLRPGLDAVVLGMLWVRLLGFLKVINKQMALFILSLNDILRDLLYFALVLLVVIFMFADMMTVVVAYQDDGQFCSTEAGAEDVVRDFCSPDPLDSYLRVYALLIGDFSLDEYRENPGMTALFVIFTVLGVIILLNVIIAIISESYERAQERSERLFARTRVLFVAQNQALESFLRPFGSPFEDFQVLGKPSRTLVVLGPLFRWCILLTLLGTAVYTEIFLCWQAVEDITHDGSLVIAVLYLVLAIIMVAGLWLLLSFAAHCFFKLWFPDRNKCRCIQLDGCTSFVVRKTASLFGTIGTDKTSLLLEDDE